MPNPRQTNVQHPTSNIQRRMGERWRVNHSALNEILLRSFSQPHRPVDRLRESGGGLRLRCWAFDVRCSMFVPIRLSGPGSSG